MIPKFLDTEILSITRPNFYQIIIKLFRVGKFGGLIRRGGVVGSVCFFFFGGGGGGLGSGGDGVGSGGGGVVVSCGGCLGGGV